MFWILLLVPNGTRKKGWHSPSFLTGAFLVFSLFACQTPYVDHSRHSVSPEIVQIPGGQALGKRVYFRLAKNWDEVQRSPTEMSARVLAYKRNGRKGPSIQLVVYDGAYAVKPSQYLEQLRSSWQKSPHLREIRSPEVRSYSGTYGYVLHFMSPDYLYMELILFVVGRAVHFIFQSPHRELKENTALASFYRQAYKQLEQGIYLRP